MLPSDLKKKQEERLAEAAIAKAEIAKERVHLKNLFATGEPWKALEITIWRKMEAYKLVMLTSMSEREVFDARASFRALEWVLGLPREIP